MGESDMKKTTKPIMPIEAFMQIVLTQLHLPDEHHLSSSEQRTCRVSHNMGHQPENTARYIARCRKEKK
jgi:hypothetical protein